MTNITITGLTAVTGLDGTELTVVDQTSAAGDTGTFSTTTAQIAGLASGSVTAAQTANRVYAGPAVAPAAIPTFRALVSADLPNPTTSLIGGVKAYVAVANQWINAISATGTPSSTQPAASDLSNGVTGTGAVVLANTPTLITPVLGVATATSINKLTITAPASGSTLTIADGKTINASVDLTVAGTALSVQGRSANSTGTVTAIAAVAASDAVLRESGSVVGFGTIATAGIANNAVTYAKIQQGTALSVLGVTGNATANLADIAGTANQVLRLNSAGTAVAFGTAAILGGGTGQTTAVTAFNALSPQTTRGDIITRDASNDIRLAVGTASQVLGTDGTDPIWSTAAIPLPRGRLSLATATPVSVTDQSAKTTVFWCLYGGNLYPWYNGSRWTIRSIAELSIALDSNAAHTGYQQSGKNFDLFLTNDAGTDRLVTGPAWTSDTARAQAISQVNGVYVNTASMTTKFDTTASNLTVAASQGTYVGTMRASADGQTQLLFGGIGANGSQAFIGLWNYYNRVSVAGFIGDSTDSWTYTLATIRAANASNTMRVSFVSGVAEDSVYAKYYAMVFNSTVGALFWAGVGYDATTAFATGSFHGGSSQPTSSVISPAQGEYATTAIGFHYLQALEAAQAVGTCTWYGDNAAATTYQSGLLYSWRY